MSAHSQTPQKLLRPALNSNSVDRNVLERDLKPAHKVVDLPTYKLSQAETCPRFPKPSPPQKEKEQEKEKEVHGEGRSSLSYHELDEASLNRHSLILTDVIEPPILSSQAASPPEPVSSALNIDMIVLH